MSDVPMQSPFRPVGDGSSSPAAASLPPNLDSFTKEQLYRFAQQQLQEAEQRAALQAQQLQQLQFQAQLASAAPGAASPLPAVDAASLGAALAQALAANSPIHLPTFDGSGNAAGLAAHSWLQQVERAFEEREQIAGSLADSRRLAAASVALRGGADTWYASLAQRPTTWAAFKGGLLARFQPASALRLIESQLRTLVERTAKLRDRLNTRGIERYTQQFQLLANQLPATMMLERSKVMLYSEALPTRLRELVITEDEKALQNPGALPGLQLNLIVDKILQRAVTRETAAGSAAGYSSSSRSTSDDMDLSAIERCCRMFGVSAMEAQLYLEPSEGWAARDTDAPESSSPPTRADHHPPGGSRSTASVSTSADLAQLLQATLAAMGHSGRGPSGGSGSSGAASSTRRQVPASVHHEVPAHLVQERRDAGLCVKCGVHKYEPGGNGHNSRTCKTPADKTTGAAEGKRRAGLSQSLFQ
jgi:hypothetical protein